MRKGKNKAIKDFLAKLRDGRSKRLIKKAVLFGSTAKGMAQKDSDIDILLFSTQPKQIEKAADKAAFEVLLSDGEVIELQIRPESDFKNPKSYFVFQALQNGKELQL